MKLEIPTKRQIDICKKYGSRVIPYSLEDMVAVALETIDKSPIVGMRYILDAGDNVSWFFYCGENSDDDDFYRTMHVGHLGEFVPEVIDYLCLEPGYRFVIDREGYEDVWKSA
ncbi:hypothetical protein D3C85_1529280 [compost metagenome]